MPCEYPCARTSHFAAKPACLRHMRAAIFNEPRSITVGDRRDPVIAEPTDAIVRVVLACVCGSDLWYYRGDSPFEPGPIGHEFIGVVEDVGADVSRLCAGRPRRSRRSPSATAPARTASTGSPPPASNGGFFPDERRRRPGRGRPRAARRRHARHRPRLRPLRRDAALAADPLRRHGHRPPRRRLRAGAGRARPSPSSATAPSASPACWPPSASAPSGSSR